MELNTLRGPHIVISSSGMATGGRVLHHLANRLPDPRNIVVLAGFQAEGTRGRLLADGATTLRLLGKDVPVRAEIMMVEAFSSHADSVEMMAWLEGMSRRPKQTYLVHGELAASAGLQKLLAERLDWPSSIPCQGEPVTID
jgi:metallo-beta-lactamase family protein